MHALARYHALKMAVIMPRCACASEVYGSVFVYLCVWTATAAQG